MDRGRVKRAKLQGVLNIYILAMATLDFILVPTAIMDNGTGHFVATYSNSRAILCKLGLEDLPFCCSTPKFQP